MDIEKTLKNLHARHIEAEYYETAAQALEALCAEVQGKRVVFGGSVTLRDMGAFDALRERNDVYWHWVERSANQRQIECDAQVYMASANALAETGEIVNIDGTGNRVAGAMYGCESVYYVVGVNKLAPDLNAAIERARQVAAPRNAQRLKAQTPCAVDGKCHDCRSSGRICNILSVIMGKPNGVGRCKVLLVGEMLGY